MAISNRREHGRLKIDRTVKISVQLFPVMPFVGHSVDVGLINISSGGLALRIDDEHHKQILKKKEKVVLHLRWPGLAIEECRGVVTHSYVTAKTHHVVGIRFERLSNAIRKELEQMSKDNVACDQRISDGEHAWCVPTCSFMALCRKPIRMEDDNSPLMDSLEISLQRVE